jgi:hypothetical protein
VELPGAKKYSAANERAKARKIKLATNKRNYNWVRVISRAVSRAISRAISRTVLLAKNITCQPYTNNAKLLLLVTTAGYSGDSEALTTIGCIAIGCNN